MSRYANVRGNPKNRPPQVGQPSFAKASAADHQPDAKAAGGFEDMQRAIEIIYKERGGDKLDYRIRVLEKTVALYEKEVDRHSAAENTDFRWRVRPGEAMRAMREARALELQAETLRLECHAIVREALEITTARQAANRDADPAPGHAWPPAPDRSWPPEASRSGAKGPIDTPDFVQSMMSAEAANVPLTSAPRGSPA